MISRWLVSGLGIVGTVISFQLFASTATQVDQSQQAEQAHKRPTVAVVLAGGGAKGAAHIGVLKALEEMQIPVDYITGTSMGSYVGGLYATGMSADEIESFIYTVDWNRGYRDRVNRSDRRVRDKEYEDRYQLNTDLGLGWGEIKARKGVVQGQNMLRILRETTGNLSSFDSFDHLAIPYRSVATDIIELEEVVIDHGHLVDAMMASMSVPGALPPYDLDGRMLVDGGVTNNMPVDVARAMGADIVIAVDISTNYKGKDDFTNFLAAADQLSNYLVQRSTQEQAETLTDDDVFLRPDVGEMETTDFDKMPSAFLAGYEAAKQHTDELSKLSLSNADYQHYIEDKQKARRQLKHGDQTVVDRVVINNNTHYSDKLIENRLNLDSGKVLKTSEIESKVQDLYALDRFELVTYEFDTVDGEEQLQVDVNEKSWGPNYLNFRFFLEDDFSTTSQYSIGVSANFTDINSHGAELRTNIEMGTDKRIEAELYSPFFSSQKLFTSASIAYSKENRNLPVDIDDIEEPTLDVTKDYFPMTYSEYVGELALGYQPTLWQELKFGARYTDGDVEVASLPSLGNGGYKRIGGFINYRLDTLDNFSLPTEGYFVDLEYLVSHDDFQNDSSINETELTSESDTVYEFSANLMAAKSIEKHTLVAKLDYGIVESKNSIFPIDPKELGGFLNLSGIPRNSMIGQNLAYTSLIYRYKWFENDFGLFESPFYVGASIEHGGVWSNNDLSIDEAPMYTAGSVFAGVDSPIGPIILAYGRTEDNYDSVYLIVGTSYK
ncbi:patatin-like phospholipase family protein [Vibrio sp. 10N.247.311.14]|uniref:patatin-like phospholipase family protein n=1 Tax=unclassified Vibrio TaxID=2614977 RepID=UPI000C848213|nr:MULTISPECIES: patatin-like phospholipase family protein [unclassified Vibrio]PMK20964.1 serine protease [Vibrio sp. 10N.261.54.C3]PMN95803.1 serine protease [Vibrio sp. 10N.222.55.F9]PMO03279.1 serine protease [Vibrio sp. 10N.222.55.C12]PMO14387.1 serine protease [Vibrio sp. 10N.222.54.F10]PMO14426.1 serine protease [Vibrio sp. 10N.222.54.B6]